MLVLFQYTYLNILISLFKVEIFVYNMVFKLRCISCTTTFAKWKFYLVIVIHINRIYCFIAISVEACRRNIKFNGSVASSNVDSQLDDAHVYMLTDPKEFDMV